MKIFAYDLSVPVALITDAQNDTVYTFHISKEFVHIYGNGTRKT